MATNEAWVEAARLAHPSVGDASIGVNLGGVQTDNNLPGHGVAFAEFVGSVRAPTGGYTIANRRSDLALTMSSNATGQQVTQAMLASAADQRWNLVQTVAPDFTSGQFVMTNVNSGAYAEVVGSTSGTQADQYRNVNHPDQYWTFTKTGSYCTIKNVFTGDVLDSAGATASGSAVVENPTSGTATQQWSLVDTGAGKYQVVNQASGLALAVTGASTANGALLDQEASAPSSQAQLWAVSKIN